MTLCRRRVVFHVTGFGVFNGIADNPTTHLINELPAELRARLRGRSELEASREAAGMASGGGDTSEPRRGGEDGLPVDGEEFELRTTMVLDVSAKEGGRQLRELHALARGGVGGGRSDGVDDDVGERGALAPEGRVGDEGVVTVFVHCGVNDGAKRFALEIQAFNEATFGAPDEKGYCPSCAPVEVDNPDTRHVRVTTVPVARVLEGLGRKGWGLDDVADSRDAGRFVCNYMYYISLGLCARSVLSEGAVTTKSEDLVGLIEEEEVEEEVREKAEEGGMAASTSGGAVGHEWHSLFIHVPPFRVVRKDLQLAFLVDCLSATAECLADTSAVAAAGQSKSSSIVGEAAVSATAADTTPMRAASSTRKPVRPLAVSPCRASVLVEPPPSPSGDAGSKNVPQQQAASPAPRQNPPVRAERASPPSIWNSDAPSPVSGGSPQARRRGDYGGGRGRSSAATENFAETSEDPGYLRDDDEEEGGGRQDELETRRLETTAQATKRRLAEAGFDELDVDAAMATTGSSNADVNMHFLLENTALLPRGAPSQADGLYLRDFLNDTSAIAAAAGGAEGGGSYGRRRASATSGPREGQRTTAGHSRTMSAGSPAGMGGVSPRWIGEGSPAAPAAPAAGGGKIAAGGGKIGAGTPSPRGTADQSNSNPDSARAKGGGLLNRFRRHKKNPSTGAASASSTTFEREGTGGPGARGGPSGTSRGRGGGGGGRYGRPRSSSTTTREASPVYSRRTTGSHRSHSPPRLRAGDPSSSSTFPSGVSSGWGEILPTGPNLRLALLVRLDLEMGPGAMAAQCSRATLAAVRQAQGTGGGNTLAVWRDAGQAIVVLGVADSRALDSVLAIGAASHLPVAMVRDKTAGWMGNVSADSCTVAAIGPAPMSTILAITGSLRVL